MTARHRARRRRRKMHRWIARARRARRHPVVTTPPAEPAPRPWALVTWRGPALVMREPSFHASRADAENAAPKDEQYTVVDISKPTRPRPSLDDLLSRGRIPDPQPQDDERRTQWPTR
jgi:hypothetical protein